MLVREYRIVMPMTTAEFQIGRAFAYMETARKQTHKGEGVEIVQDDPFDNIPLCHGRYNEGQFTHKIYHHRQLAREMTHFPGAEKLVGLEHRKINFKFHQQIFTSIDSWFGLTWDEVREQEVQLRTELDTQRAAYGLCFFSLR
uniref:Phosphatidylinositol transfer protein N-terminal domain-containing protein n=1 Tax=Meloidogyne incognita TaxID=6306 RepID=A0A914KYS7_MELIC